MSIVKGTILRVSWSRPEPIERVESPILVRSRVAGCAVLFAVAAVGCTNSPPTVEKPSTVNSPHASPSMTGAILRIVASHAYRARHAPSSFRLGHVVVLGPKEVEFPMGGSGSCPPVARAATMRGPELRLLLAPDHSSCTTDLVTYAVVVTLSEPIFGPHAEIRLTRLDVGYKGSGTLYTFH